MEKALLLGNGINNVGSGAYTWATLIRELTYQEAIVKNYAVMDANAFGLCKANQLPIVVFNINQPGAIKRVLEGDPDIGTIVR